MFASVSGISFGYKISVSVDKGQISVFILSFMIHKSEIIDNKIWFNYKIVSVLMLIYNNGDGDGEYTLLLS